MKVKEKMHPCLHMHMVNVLDKFDWLEGEVRMNMEKIQFIWDYFSPIFIIANWTLKSMF